MIGHCASHRVARQAPGSREGALIPFTADLLAAVAGAQPRAVCTVKTGGKQRTPFFADYFAICGPQIARKSRIYHAGPVRQTDDQRGKPSLYAFYPPVKTAPRLRPGPGP